MENRHYEKGIGALIGLIVIILLIAGGVFYFKKKEAIAPYNNGNNQGEDIKMSDDEMMKENVMEDSFAADVDNEAMLIMKEMSFAYSGDLMDVSGGAASGIAKADFSEGVYRLLATFSDLPDPTGTDFYEGWVVRRGENMSVISTGRVPNIEGIYTNSYMSASDLTGHDFYVLTLEPDDGDPAPAAHIVEGMMEALR